MTPSATEPPGLARRRFRAARVGVGRALLGAALALPAACGDDTRVRTLEVAAHRQECVGVGYRLCLLVREPGETDYSFLYDGIRGFDPVWGTRYVVRIEEEDVPDPPADASSIRRTLTEILDEESAAGETFRLRLTPLRVAVEELDPGWRYRIHHSREIACAEPLDCAALDELLRPETPLRIWLLLEHPAEASAPLIVRGWEEVEAVE